MTMLQAVGFLQSVREHQLLVREYLHSRSRSDDLSPIQQVHPAAEIDDKLQIVRRYHPGRRESPYEAGQLSSSTGVEVARRLIEDEYAGVAGEYACKADPLFFTAAQMVRRSPLEPFQPHLSERLADNPVDLPGRGSELCGTKRHVLLHGGTEELIIRVLEEEPDHPVHFVEVRARNPVPANDDLTVTAVVLREYPVQMEQERRFSGPVGTDDPDTFSFGGMHGNTPERRLSVRIGIREIIHFEHIHQRHPLAVMAA